MKIIEVANRHQILREDKLINVLKKRAESLRIFNHKTEYLKNLNQMITTDWIPEFYIKKACVPVQTPQAKL